MQLSRNFSLAEMCKSQTAERKGIPNQPNAGQIEALVMLCENILQPVREEFGSFIVSSGFRSPELCVAIGSKITSQHCCPDNLSAAADFEVAGYDNHDLCVWIQDNLVFDQLILECYNGEMNSGWVHCSYAETDNRADVLTFDRTNGYRKGLIA